MGVGIKTNSGIPKYGGSQVTVKSRVSEMRAPLRISFQEVHTLTQRSWRVWSPTSHILHRAAEGGSSRPSAYSLKQVAEGPAPLHSLVKKKAPSFSSSYLTPTLHPSDVGSLGYQKVGSWQQHYWGQTCPPFHSQPLFQLIQNFWALIAFSLIPPLHLKQQLIPRKLPSQGGWRLEG